MEKLLSFFLLFFLVLATHAQPLKESHKLKYVYAKVYTISDPWGNQSASVAFGGSDISAEEAESAACELYADESAKVFCRKGQGIKCGAGYSGAANSQGYVDPIVAKSRNEPHNAVGISCGMKTQKAADEAAIKACEASRAKLTAPGRQPCIAVFAGVKDVALYKM